VKERAMESEVIKINDEQELEPAIYSVSVTRKDGSKDTLRLNVFQLQELRTKLGLPSLPMQVAFPV
jgi:hypothetical protein